MPTIKIGSDDLGAAVSLFDNRYQNFIDSNQPLDANSPQWQPSMPPAQQLNAPQAPWRCDYNIEGD